MTNSFDKLEFDSIITDLKATSTKQVFQNLASHIHRLIGTPEDKIINELSAQEKSICSAIGHGVSVPHMRLPRLTRPLIIFAKLKNAVDFDANDNEWVDMVCLVLSPEYEGSKHLQRLSFVTRCFLNQSFCDDLRNAGDNEDIKFALKQMNAERLAA